MRRPAARTRQMLGEDRGEGRRHMLGDQHRAAVDHGPEFGHQRHQRLRPAGGRADDEHARRLRAEGALHQRRLRRGGTRRRRMPVGRQRGRERGAGNRRLGAADLGAEGADFLDQVVMEDLGGGRLARALGLRNVVGGAERQRLEADLRVAPRQRRGHDDDEVALLREQLRQRGDAVELRHFDVEHGDVGLDAVELVDGVEPGAQRGRDFHVRLGVHPARDQPADDHGIVDHHDPELCLPGGLGRRTRQRNTHTSPDADQRHDCKTQQRRWPDSRRNATDQIRPTSWNLAVTMSLSNGFMMYSLAPACSARAMCATSFSVVQNTTFGTSPPGMRRRLPRNS